MRKGRVGLVSLLCSALILGFWSIAWSHCEIPCGIYNDPMRINMLEEHVMTIEKSMNQIKELSGHQSSEDVSQGHKHQVESQHQLVRWIVNKEEHAKKFQNVVWQYFMTQRVKPGDKNYEQKVTLLHQMLYYAMKCKQTTDTDHVKKLMNLIDQFEKVYFQKK